MRSAAATAAAASNHVSLVKQQPIKKNVNHPPVL